MTTATPSIEGVFRYVLIPNVERYLAAGWIDCGLCPAHHGAWSFLLKACVCNPEGRPVPREALG